jgi:CMP-2-keto-3-deoxyoctulosonic acid synthetase
VPIQHADQLARQPVRPEVGRQQQFLLGLPRRTVTRRTRSQRRWPSRTHWSATTPAAWSAALDGNEMSTAATPIKDLAEFENPNVVKAVVSANGRALYFSRHTVPYLRDHAGKPAAERLAAFPFLKHLGIYGYRRATLLRLVTFPVSPLEAAEKLEQLRALENGIAIAVARVNHDSVGVDVPADVARVEKLLGELSLR